ncbi:MAG: peptide transporter permease [Enterovirga sp.]|nr:peptide transporter permease [Enterovirga sp.]
MSALASSDGGAEPLPVLTPGSPGRPTSGARWWRHKSLVLGGGVLAVIVLLALFAPLLAPHDPYVQNLARRTIPPVWYDKGSWAHPLGTDALGRDYLSRTIYGARISLLIGVSVAVLSGLIGTVLGVAAGYFGGRVDLLVTFLITVRLALPVILVALAAVAVVGGSLPLVILVLGLLKWDRFVVVMRSATQSVRSLDYVQAARASGASTARIIWREVLPNVLPFLIVTATLEAASAILLEAALSFLGLGIQPPLPSWGLMISEAKPYMFFSFWLIAIPGACLATLILSINLLGDGLRDAISPDRRAAT